MKTSELREKSAEELKKLLSETEESARKLRFDLATRQVKNTKELRNAKRQAARILTIINEK